MYVYVLSENKIARKELRCLLGHYAARCVITHGRRWDHISNILAEQHRLPWKQRIHEGPTLCYKALIGLPPAYLWVTSYHCTWPLGTWDLQFKLNVFSRFRKSDSSWHKEHRLLLFTNLKNPANFGQYGLQQFDMCIYLISTGYHWCNLNCIACT